MSDVLLDCPACGSTLRVSLEVVRIKPPQASDILPVPPAPPPPPPRESTEAEAIRVCTRVAAEHGVRLDDLRADDRNPRLVDARKAAASAARAETDASLPEIGRALGRDHSTVIHYLRSSE